MSKKNGTAKSYHINQKKQVLRVFLEAVAAFIFALLVETAFNYPAITAGYKPVAITDNTTTSKGKLVFEKKLEEPVYIKKLILQGSVDKKSSYTINLVTVNDFGNEETVEMTDSMSTELNAAFTNINKKVKEIQITFKHSKNIHLTSISYSNEINFNKYRILFFWLTAFLILLILLEKKLILHQIWFVYMIAALGYGTLMIATAGTHAVTWDEEVHYATVHNAGFSSVINLNSAVLQNFVRNDWNSVNTAEEGLLLNRYLNEEAQKEEITYEIPRSFKNYITHFPMIIAYHLGELAGLSYTDNYMLGRLGNLLFCVLCNVLAIVLARRKKVLLAVVGMMPTVIFQSSMYTYDGVCFSCITVGAVLCLNELEKKRGTESLRNIAVAAAVLCIGCVVKPVYFPVLFLLIPSIWGKAKPVLNTKEKKKTGICILVLLVLVISGMTVLKLRPLTDSIAEGNLAYGGDLRGGDTGMAGQILSIAEHPIAFGKMLVRDIFSFDNFRNAKDQVENTTLICNQMFLNLYYLGTLKEVWALVLLPLLSVLFLVEPQGEPAIGYSKKNSRFWCALAVILSVVLIWLAMYLTFTPIGAGSIEGVQARYYLPLVLPFAYIVKNNRIQLKISRLNYHRIVLGAGLLLISECIYKYLIVGKAL